MTKGDLYTKEIITRILDEGCLDENPRPKYSDGVSAHTLSVNHGMCTYDQTKGESPLLTLRPIAVKSAIGELLWIYRDQSNNLDELADKYKVTWWDDWDLGHIQGIDPEYKRTIGNCYGGTIKKYNIMEDFWKEIFKNQEQLYGEGMKFTQFLEQYYILLYGRLAPFDKSWLKEMEGRIPEKTAIPIMRKVLDTDDQINASIWNMELNEDAFCEYVFINIMALLRAGENDCRFFIFLLEHLLYGE